MDDTGSTTFVLFDRQVTQFIGRTVEDLIKEHDKVVDRYMYYIGAFFFTEFSTNIFQSFNREKVPVSILLILMCSLTSKFFSRLRLVKEIS
jgi:hypothetical protein